MRLFAMLALAAPFLMQAKAVYLDSHSEKYNQQLATIEAGDTVAFPDGSNFLVNKVVPDTELGVSSKVFIAKPITNNLASNRALAVKVPAASPFVYADPSDTGSERIDTLMAINELIVGQNDLAQKKIAKVEMVSMMPDQFVASEYLEKKQTLFQFLKNPPSSSRERQKRLTKLLAFTRRFAPYSVGHDLSSSSIVYDEIAETWKVMDYKTQAVVDKTTGGKKFEVLQPRDPANPRESHPFGSMMVSDLAEHNPELFGNGEAWTENVFRQIDTGIRDQRGGQPADVQFLTILSDAGLTKRAERAFRPKARAKGRSLLRCFISLFTGE